MPFQPAIDGRRRILSHSPRAQTTGNGADGKASSGARPPCTGAARTIYSSA